MVAKQTLEDLNANKPSQKSEATFQSLSTPEESLLLKSSLEVNAPLFAEELRSVGIIKSMNLRHLKLAYNTEVTRKRDKISRQIKHFFGFNSMLILVAMLCSLNVIDANNWEVPNPSSALIYNTIGDYINNHLENSTETLVSPIRRSKILNEKPVFPRTIGLERGNFFPENESVVVYFRPEKRSSHLSEPLVVEVRKLLKAFESIDVKISPLPWDNGRKLNLSIITNNVVRADAELSLEYAEKKAKCKTEDKYLLLQFGAKWCAPCRKMKAGIENNNTLSNIVSSNYEMMYVDIDHFDGISLKMHYNVSLLPTIIILDTDGNVVKRFEESISDERMITEFAALANGKQRKVSEDFINFNPQLVADILTSNSKNIVNNY